MSINYTQNTSAVIQGVCFNSVGALDVTIGFTTDGTPSNVKNYVIPPEEASLLLDVSTNGETIRASLIASIYTYLVQKGLIIGAVV